MISVIWIALLSVTVMNLVYEHLTWRIFIWFTEARHKFHRWSNPGTGCCNVMWCCFYLHWGKSSCIHWNWDFPVSAKNCLATVSWQLLWDRITANRLTAVYFCAVYKIGLRLLSMYVKWATFTIFINWLLYVYVDVLVHSSQFKSACCCFGWSEEAGRAHGHSMGGARREEMSEESWAAVPALFSPDDPLDELYHHELTQKHYAGRFANFLRLHSSYTWTSPNLLMGPQDPQAAKLRLRYQITRRTF